MNDVPEPGRDRIIRLPKGPGGGDPLVGDYLRRCRPTCAVKVLSPLWLLVGALLILTGGVIGHHGWGTSQPPPVDPDHAGWVEHVDGGWSMGLGRWWTDLGERFALLLNEHLGDPEPVLWGMLIAALVAALLARFIHARRIPATHEPLIVLPLVALTYLAFYDTLVFWSVATGLVCVVYILAICYRLLAVACSAIGGRGLRSDVLDEPGSGWPYYTVLVPLYRETAVADKIMRHLRDIDYPKDRLDVKLLLEADDPDTLTAIEAAGVPGWAEVVVVPDDQPKTKPRACNHGLARARGEFLVIFDAEDRPEPDQLKQAVLAFRRLERQDGQPHGLLRSLLRFLLFFRGPAPTRIVCLQAQLAYHNHAQNLLTRWFALEYNVWFRAYLPGLVRLGAAVPLGGTSNHFRTEVLRELSGWDPFNVTEDCDLGVRLHLAGHRTAILDSVTWEEANSRVGNWIRQRSRWMKGYLVTHLVWMRRPLWLFTRLGIWGTVSFLSSIVGVAGLAVLNMILWAIMVWFFWTIGTDLAAGKEFGDLIISHRDSLQPGARESLPLVITGPREDPAWFGISVVLFIGSLFLFVANLLFVLINLCFGMRRGQRGLIPAALISPLYWVLISIGAWKGFWQMLVRPHYWEKTVHGLDQDGDADADPSEGTTPAPVSGAGA